MHPQLPLRPLTLCVGHSLADLAFVCGQIRAEALTGADIKQGLLELLHWREFAYRTDRLLMAVPNRGLEVRQAGFIVSAE